MHLHGDGAGRALGDRLPELRRQRDLSRVARAVEALVVERGEGDVKERRVGRGARELENRGREAAREDGAVVRVEPRERGVGGAASLELRLRARGDVARVVLELEGHREDRRAGRVADVRGDVRLPAEQARGREEARAVDGAEARDVERPAGRQRRRVTGEVRGELLRGAGPGDRQRGVGRIDDELLPRVASEEGGVAQALAIAAARRASVTGAAGGVGAASAAGAAGRSECKDEDCEGDPSEGTGH